MNKSESKYYNTAILMDEALLALLKKKDYGTDEEIIEAIKTAQGEDIINVKGSLDGEVSEGGKNFSGGQRQRLTIARALVRNAEILILDDSASALDYATDARLRMAIRGMKNPPTTFIVSQRAASVMHADKIIVLVYIQFFVFENVFNSHRSCNRMGQIFGFL